MLRFANPSFVLRFAARVVPIFGALAAILIAAGLYLVFFVAPADYQQGETVRIMYIHVPAAWLGMFAYMVMASAALGTLVWRHPVADAAQKSAAPLGAMFTFVCLVTGSLWGKPMWGAWWVWDARLTSVLVLFFLYLGYMALLGAFDDPVRGGRAASILAIVGAVNVPVIKWSVDWWNTLHQPASVARMDGPSIHPSMLLPLLLMATGFGFYFAAVLLLRVRAELAARRIRALRLAAMEAEA